MHTYEVDPEILSGFIDESMEALEPLDTLFIELEKNPEETDLVNAIFRPIHSIKGSSAFFGLLHIKTLSHKMEDVLDRVRQHQLRVTPGMVQELLSGLDLLKSLFSRVRSGEKEVEEERVFKEAIDTLSAIVLQDEFPRELGTPKSAIEFLGDLIFKLEEIRALLPENESKQIDQAEGIISKIVPGLIVSPNNEESPPKSGQDAGDDPIKTLLEILSAPIPDLLDEGLSDRVGYELAQLLKTAPSPEAKRIVEKALEEYEAFMRRIGFDDLLREMILEKITLLKGMGTVKRESPQERFPPPAPKDAGPPPGGWAERRSGYDRRDSQAGPGEKTMRVSEKNMDAFLSYVSELVVIEEMFTYLQKKLLSSTGKEMASEFKRVIETFGDLSANLRQSILAIRKVPARAILQKAPRIIHDIANSSGKKVSIHIEGEDIPIDKSYVDMLDAPFVHMVRNAVDHGIEPEEERIAAGKEPVGAIRITLKETKKEIELSIEDDGRGLDYDAIAIKAQAMGLIAPGETPDEAVVKEFLFMSGLSTAKEVTDISGRGVGMDVVRKSIESAGGKIRIESIQGKGSTFVISLPRSISTQIMEGFLFRAGKEIYVMPMEMIGESFAVEENNLTSVGGVSEMVLRRGELLPVIRLSKEFEEDFFSLGGASANASAHKSEGVAISVTLNGKRHALLVNEIIGLQKVVVRTIKGMVVNEKLFDGAAMLGDGRVAMILGTEGLKRLL